MQYTVKLPEDEDLVVFGRVINLGRLPDGQQAVGVLSTENQFVDGRWIQKGQPIKLTPLAVILDSQKALVYSPRDHLGVLDDAYRLWLVTHPEWPGDVGQLSHSAEELPD